MSIYTKTGDKGTTALFGGKRLSKDDPQVEAYGTLDELSSFIGLIISRFKTKQDQQFLLEIQKDLYAIMGVLAGAHTPINYLSKRVNTFEQKIDDIQSHLPELKSFILPSGSEISSLFHVVRSICRRAERSAVRLIKHTTNSQAQLGLILQYLNRLSDLLFVLARWYNENKELKVSLLKKDI